MDEIASQGASSRAFNNYFISKGRLWALVLIVGLNYFYGSASLFAQEAGPGRFSFSASSYSVSEGDDIVEVVVIRTGGSNGSARLIVSPQDGLATEPADFALFAMVYEWADGESGPKLATVQIMDDDVAENEETFSLEILRVSTSFPGAIVGEIDRAEVVITDDDEQAVLPPTGVVQFVPRTINIVEGAQTQELEVVRVGGSRGPISVNFIPIDEARDDGRVSITMPLQTISNQPENALTWADRDASSRIIKIKIADNGQTEGNLELKWRLGSSQRWLIGSPSRAAMQVRDDDTNPSEPLSTGRLITTAAGLVSNESDGEAVVAISRVSGSAGVLRVFFQTVSDTAIAGEDYTQTSGDLTWDDGESGRKEVSIPIIADNEIEPEESFTLLFENAEPQMALPDGEDQSVRITIRDTGSGNVLPDPPGQSDPPSTNFLRLVPLDGNDQSGMPGEEFYPLVVQAVDSSGAAVSGTPIHWAVLSSGEAALLDGEQTQTDAQGVSRQRIEVTGRGLVRIAARALLNDDQGADPTTATPLGDAEGDVVFEIRSGMEFSAGLTANASRVAGALDSACVALRERATSPDIGLTIEQQSLLDTCSVIEARMGGVSLQQALDRLAPEEFFFIGDSIADTSDRQFSNVLGRLNALRSRQTGRLDIGALSMNVHDQHIPGSVFQAAFDGFGNSDLLGAPAQSGQHLRVPRYGFFASGNLSFGEINGAGVESDTDFSAQGLTIGGDMRVSYNAIVGAAIGLSVNQADFTESGGQADMDATSLSLFGTWYDAGTGYADVMMELGSNGYEITRKASLPEAADAFATSSTDATTWAMSIGAGRDYKSGDWEFGPYGRLRFLSADVDGFQEQAAGAAAGSALRIDGHTVQSGSVSLGGQVARTITRRKVVLVPQARFEIELENETRKDDLSATFLHDPSATNFSIQGNERDSAWLNLSLGGSAVFHKGRTAYAFYETRLAHETITQHQVRLGARFDFR